MGQVEFQSQAGDYFGEKALLRGKLSLCRLGLVGCGATRGAEPRTATIRADTMLSTLKITQKAAGGAAFGAASDLIWPGVPRPGPGTQRR